MRYPLDIGNNLDETLRFWITKYVREKARNVSTDKITDLGKFEEYLELLSEPMSSISEISTIVNALGRIKAKDVSTYAVPVIKFASFIAKKKMISMKELDDAGMVKDFLSIATASYQNTTKKNYRNALTNFFNFLSSNNENVPGSGIGYIFHVELKNWQGLSGKKGNPLPSFLDDKEMTQLIQALDDYPFSSDRAAAFYNLIVRIILMGGLRVSEAVKIKKSTMYEEKVEDEENMFVFLIEGKGNKRRYVKIDAEVLRPHLERWLSISGCEGPLLFCQIRDPRKNANTDSVSHFVGKLFDSCGIKKNKMGAHVLRHSYGTYLYKQTQDIRLVQELMGHESIQTTSIYTHLSDDTKRKASRVMAKIEKRE